MNILGVSCFYHDSAAALIQDGIITAAAAEERFSGKKHDADFPGDAIAFCLEKAGLGIEEIDYITFYDKPLLKFDRILSSYLQTAPKSYGAFRKAIPIWLREKIWLPQTIKKELGYDGEILFTEHHQAHAAGAFFSSPFEQAAILTIDGVGEWATASIGRGEKNKIELLFRQDYPHSVGLLYSAFTYYLGFQVNSSEYKVMGLAPYGEPKYAELIRTKLVEIGENGAISLNMKYFHYHYGLTMTGKRFKKLFGRSRRLPEQEIEQFHKDIASSLQCVTEEIIFKMADHALDLTGEKYLCLSGGVALNCTAAGKLLKRERTKDISLYIQPAATDSGGAIGAALYVYHGLSGKREIAEQNYLRLGPSYSASDIEQFLDGHDIAARRLTEAERSKRCAEYLGHGKIVAIFQGEMEFGPRALGFRSILADPRDPEMKARINEAVKFREPFRPFAPVVLEEKASEYFDCTGPSPYMLLNFFVHPEKRSEIPAVTHVDGSSRIQTVNAGQNKALYDIIREFETLSGTPVLLNTSFNLRGHPIVRTPEQAFATFISSGIDILIMENFLIEKSSLDHEKYRRLGITAGQD